MATNYKKLKSDLQKQGRMTLFVPHNEDLPCIGFEPTWSKTKILKVLLQFDDIRKEYTLWMNKNLLSYQRK